METNEVGILTDSHFGCRKSSRHFHDYFERFYKDTFFPELDKRNIKTLFHLGDVFDVRKGIDYWALGWAKRVFFNPLEKRGIQLHMLVGNHDAYYKNTLTVNSLKANLSEYSNITYYDSPQTVTVNEKEIFMVPWVCDDNADKFIKENEKSKAKICFGHLELVGFYANQNYQCTTGIDSKLFSKYDTVYSGHFHKKSSSGNITYLGNPYQLYWNDVGDKRGFHIFDLHTSRLEFVSNTCTMFHKIGYSEKKVLDVKFDDYVGAYVKIIVDGKSDSRKLHQFVQKLNDANVYDIKVIENYDIVVGDTEIRTEDTLTSCSNYIEAMEGVDKENIINIIKNLYLEAQNVSFN